ncbi:transglutaminase-like domain-containing protein [Thiobacillus denitrificans]|uniref:transglutaminase-like domain-containing protein n=1 Tax=Thiobacillus denitrificans TaxID=36861 RepID=UPI00075D3B95|nr:transglutaminase family protein [Thiobacillus denitrificans]
MELDLTFQLALQGRFRDLALWLPVPQDTPQQRRLALESVGNHAELSLHRDPLYGAPMLFVRWQGVQDDPQLTVSTRVETREMNCDLAQARADAPLPEDTRRYLAASTHVPVEGEVRTRAEAITQGLDTSADKLRALYDWVLAHAQRRFDVAWCGLGDVPAMLAAGEFCGKCVDINSLLVALCRAAGLPARTVLGVRAAPSRFDPALGASGDVTQALHTRAEVYLGGLGWVPVDPADALKLADAGVPDTLQREVSAYLLGSAEANWVAYNHARDFQLAPPATGGPLNFFTVPYAETDGMPLNIEAGTQGYSIFSHPTGS